MSYALTHSLVSLLEAAGTIVMSEKYGTTWLTCIVRSILAYLARSSLLITEIILGGQYTVLSSQYAADNRDIGARRVK